MNRNAEISKELKALNSSLAGMPRHIPFSVPDGYVAGLAAALAEGVNISEREETILSVANNKALPFAVPADYFPGLAQTLAAEAAKQNAGQLPVTLPYVAPKGYFEKLPARMLNAAKGRELQGTRAISFRPQWTRVARLAAAAILVLGISIGTYHYLHPVNPDKIAARQLAKVDGDAIHAYVEQNVDDFDSEALEAAVASNQTSLPASISTLDAKEIQDYLQDGDGTM